jgi:hypothetical protein
MLLSGTILTSGNVWNAVSINASYIVFDGFELEGKNANITYATTFESYTNYLINVKDWARIANFNTNALTIGGPATESKFPHHFIIRNCKVHDFPGGGINAIQSDYVTIENNLVYNNAWYMMYAGSPSTNFKFRALHLEQRTFCFRIKRRKRVVVF